MELLSHSCVSCSPGFTDVSLIKCNSVNHIIKSRDLPPQKYIPANSNNILSSVMTERKQRPFPQQTFEQEKDICVTKNVRSIKVSQHHSLLTSLMLFLCVTCQHVFCEKKTRFSFSQRTASNTKPSLCNEQIKQFQHKVTHVTISVHF